MASSTNPPSSGKLAVWLLRAAWVALAFFGPAGVSAALEGRLDAVRWTAAIGLWLAWFVTLVALLIPGVSTLTVARLIVPMAPGAMVAALVADRHDRAGAPVIVALGLSAAATVLALGADVGQHFIQASAYGHEVRFALRPPGPLLLGPLPLSWLLTVLPATVGPLLIAARVWVVGTMVSVIGVALAIGLVPRLHQLGRRWLVFVPAGLVVHDHLPLAETVMVAAGAVEMLNLAPADTTATDLTANALGPAIEVSLRDAQPVARRGESRQAASVNISSDRLLISPTRPGRVITAARERGW